MMRNDIELKFKNIFTIFPFEQTFSIHTILFSINKIYKKNSCQLKYLKIENYVCNFDKINFVGDIENLIENSIRNNISCAQESFNKAVR